MIIRTWLQAAELTRGKREKEISNILPCHLNKADSVRRTAKSNVNLMECNCIQQYGARLQIIESVCRQKVVPIARRRMAQ